MARKLLNTNSLHASEFECTMSHTNKLLTNFKIVLFWGIIRDEWKQSTMNNNPR